MGDNTDAVDEAYLTSIGLALQSGVINVIDTSISYRETRSLAVIARTMRHFPREAIVVSSKLGKIPPECLPEGQGVSFLTKTLGLVPNRDFKSIKYNKNKSIWQSLHPAALNYTLHSPEPG